MTIQAKLLCAVAVSGFAAFAATAPAQALTMQECSAKYQAAKTAGTLNGQKWNDFRKAQCARRRGCDAGCRACRCRTCGRTGCRRLRRPRKPSRRQPAAPAAPAAVGNAVFPSAVDPKYARETPARRRMHTCSDQYNANKATNTNGGMKWNQKGAAATTASATSA